MNEGDPNYHHVVGTLIKDGALISNYGKDTGYPTNPLSILGVKADNTLKVYPFGTSYDQLISDGVVNTFCAFDQVVVNGVITETFSNYQYQWNLIGQNSDTLDIYIFDCNGKDLYGEEGMTLPNACQKLVDLGCDFVYRLDQGGSTCLCHNAVMLNDPTDDYGTTVRKTCDYLYFGKTPISEIDNAIKVANAERSDASLQAMINRANITYLEDIDNNKLIFSAPNLKHKNTSSLSGINLVYKENGTTRTTLTVDSLNRRKTLGLWDNETDATIAFINAGNPEIQVGPSTNADYMDIKGTAAGNSTVRIAGKSIIFNDHQIALWDNTTSATKIRLDSDTKRITLDGMNIADFLSSLTQKTADANIDDIDDSGFTFVNYNAETSPNDRPFANPFFLLTLKAWTNEKLQVAFPMAAGFTSGTLKIKARIRTSASWQNWVEIG